ncbi:MAG: hypothetical protein J6V47_02290 [Bacteroidaceae bacterium]|nr:hypothetical protein [Bacteroidaceae bacterium]
MKKNLFLTLALAVASFAGVNAQGWSLSLGAGDGLPGEDVQKGTQTVQVYKSDVITPSEPLTTLRFTVALNYNGEKPNGNNFVTALSELVVYAADGTTVIPYTATSNADHNTLSGGTDGAGIAALNDGNWGNYWHSCWSSTGAQADYHHLELTFAAPVSEFILEWGARPGNPKNAPLLVGLTKGGVDYVPYSDWAFTVGEEITSMDQLEGVKYFVMKSNVPVEYHTYINNHNSTEGAFGTQTTKEPNVGPGPLFVAPGVQAEDAAPSYAIQLIPADGGYYLYYVAEGKFLSKNPSDNAYNGANGGQGKTAKMSDAAIVTITEDGNGRFEMSYMMEYEDEEVEIHVGATPSTGGFKNVDKDRYDFYKEGHPYCLNYAYILAFDWSLYEVTMDYPAKYATIPVRNAIKEAKSIYTYMDSVAVEGYEDYYDEFLATLETAQDLVTTGTEDIEEVFSTVDELNYAMAMYVYSKVEWANSYYASDFCNEDGDYYGDLLTPRSNPQEGFYIEEVWNTCIQTNIIEKAEEIMYHDDMENPYSLLNTMKTFINSIADNVETFLASKVEYITLPMVYTSEDPHNTPLGTKVKDGNKDGRYDWEQSIALNEAVDGIRLTFLETNVGGAAGDGKFKNYPMVALSGLEILDVNGEKLILTSDLVSSNSEETHEREGGNGTIDKLFDDDVLTYYHSAWGDGARYDQPYTYIYLDIKFPEGTSLQNFTIKTIGRTNQATASLAPGTVCVTKYGVEYDPAIFRENPYNVKGGTQITDASQLKDGGLYIISGNLRVKTSDANPRYYSGVAPYHTNIKAALNDPCVYMFKKTANGWNIISLSKAQYWALNKTVSEVKNEETGEVTVSKSWSTGLTVYPANAAEVNFVKSGNLENTFVIYSDIEENIINASWSWTNSKDTTDVINVEEGEVNANKFVFMDWDGNLAGRPCVSEIPGEFEYGLDILNAHSKVEEFKDGDGYSAGDYLHFNKANGEGEWNIYEVTMDDPYFLWANGIPATLSSLGLIVGKDPGCIAGDVTALEAAVEAVEAVVENEDKANAEEAVLEFDANIGVAQSVERVKVEDGYYYAIESAYPEYKKQQNKIKGIFAGANGLEWKDAPAAYNFEETPDFIFKFEKYTGSDFEIPEGEEENTFLIYSEYNESYLGSGGGTTQVAFTDDFGALAYIVKPLEANIYTIYAIGSDPLHTAGHGNGSGGAGSIVNWSGGVGTCSSWTLRFVDDAEKTSISDLVVEGDEVVSVAYFTPAGAAIPAPVSGINIVVTVYSNGVIETKKVLVK